MSTVREQEVAQAVRVLLKGATPGSQVVVVSHDVVKRKPQPHGVEVVSAHVRMLVLDPAGHRLISSTSDVQKNLEGVLRFASQRGFSQCAVELFLKFFAGENT